ncbi:peptidyl-prolyl cis-trans isomerase D [Humitalea rosea]|uniref:Parvulin-like PPIase n=1 Tax=Humitalea rosea TaxID=990373 RepID=A0A2W7IL20_9PROT|nr:peptidylprolyl isomerase [Humitalea rosea]PZW40077.1 peptidyl-prolyl cis-trans isomerase D [Humitalea rosea]
MIISMRRLASTWFAKALFLLLVLSFGIWGIEDVVRNFGRDAAIARVDGAPIDLEEAQAAAQRALQRMQTQLAGRMEIDPPMREAITRQSLETLIGDRTRQAEAERLGITVPAQVVRDFIWSVPSFQGTDGRFNRGFLDQFLRQNGMGEPEFLRLVAADLSRIQLIGAVRAGAQAPASMVTALYGFAQEQRSADLVEFATLSAPDPEPPSEATLRRFHENTPERFSAPEYRGATVAVLSPTTLAGEIEIPESAIGESYASHRARYETQERRDLEQALVPGEEAAKAIAEAWRAGAALPDILAQAQAAGGGALALGDVARDGMPTPELADAAFGPPMVGGISDPVRSPYGWHVFHSVAITPATIRPLAEVHDEIKLELAMEKARDLAYERANRIEDSLAGGTTLAEAATRFGLGLAEVHTDAFGRDPEGRPVALPVTAPARPAALRAIFAASQGQGARMEEIDGGGFIGIEVKEITPAALRPYESVAADVLRLWTLDARRRHQDAQAAALMQAVEAGTPIAEAAQAQGLAVQQFGPFGRSPPAPPATGPQPPREILGPLFSLPAGGVTMAATPSGFVVAKLTGIVPADPAAAPDAVTTIRSETEQAIAADLEAQFSAALRARADVRINEALLPALVAR